MTRKINIFLWGVVFFYLIYAIAVEGPTAKLLVLLLLAVIAAAGQLVHSKRKR